MITLGPRCLYCKHFEKGCKCAAFPEGIPVAILGEEVEHLTPYKGDHGIQFELDPTLTEREKKAYQHFFGEKSE